MRRVPALVLLDGERAPEAIADELLSVAAKRFPLWGRQDRALAGVSRDEAGQTGRAV
jgi:hypothetical protein